MIGRGYVTIIGKKNSVSWTDKFQILKKRMIIIIMMAHPGSILFIIAAKVRLYTKLSPGRRSFFFHFERKLSLAMMPHFVSAETGVRIAYQIRHLSISSHNVKDDGIKGWGKE